VAESGPEIWVLAGVDGAGKSSIGGQLVRRAGQLWFNPDSAAAELLRAGFRPEEANALAWRTGFEFLQRAIAERRRYVFETTLGGRRITSSLIEAARNGMAVRIWYCGLTSVELHLARIARRVSEGGHSIPEDVVRVRFDSSRLNLIRLSPHLTELRLFDNSAERRDVRRAKPRVLMHLRAGELLELAQPGEMPEWAKPIVAAASAPGL
jgi:predicted ABC-type ATPase